MDPLWKRDEAVSILGIPNKKKRIIIEGLYDKLILKHMSDSGNYNLSPIEYQNVSNNKKSVVQFVSQSIASDVTPPTMGIVDMDEDLNMINKFKNIDYLLFDYKPDNNELPGGNAKSFDWNLLKGHQIKLPWFISGGINETNIKKIQNLLNPNGIDLSSGVEVSNGIKSNLKINNLFKKFYDN